MDGFVGNNNNGGQWKDAYFRELPPQHVDNDGVQPVDTFTRKVIRNYGFE